MKNKIIEILKSETFNTSDEEGNNYTVVEDCDFDSIAERIVKLFTIPVVNNLLCGSFEPDNKTSSATKCKCGREKWEHSKVT